jgi:ABC-type transporter Mla subunit MlaD
MHERERSKPQPSTTDISEVPVIAVTPAQELELLKSQLELSFSKKTLEAAEKANNELRAEVSELKEDLRQSRADLNDVWRQVTSLLADLAKPRRRSNPLILSEEWRLSEKDTAQNLFGD